MSKIRTGKRNPAHQQQFIEKICEYVASNYKDEQDRKKVTYLIQCNEDELADSSSYRRKLREWLNSSMPDGVDYVSAFLRKVDSFNLDDYIRVIHFDSFKVPKVPFQLPVSRHYYGLKEMREGELDFLKHTVLSKSMKPLYICSDMPVEDMAADKDFAKKYMFGLAMVLKKGLHIHIIHDVERPMKDMMLGLENWVPLYMTGQISPYYLKGVQNRVYSHLHYCSGQVAMTGDCISGHHDLAHYYLTSRKEEVSISQKNMEFLLKKAHPLMDIYREERKKELMAQNEMNGLMFKMENDPRITKTGDFLRKTSLDEFPQFINILKGDMSLVGTRPPTLDEFAQYSPYHKKRLSFRPGLTGMWQVSGRSDITDFEEIVKLDVEYIDNWSFWLDIKILLKTFLEVFTQKGAR